MPNRTHAILNAPRGQDRLRASSPFIVELGGVRRVKEEAEPPRARTQAQKTASGTERGGKPSRAGTSTNASRNRSTAVKLDKGSLPGFKAGGLTPRPGKKSGKGDDRKTMRERSAGPPVVVLRERRWWRNRSRAAVPGLECQQRRSWTGVRDGPVCAIWTAL